MYRYRKFRGKTLDTHTWVFGDLINFFDGGIGIFNNDGFNYHHFRVDKETVGQFTGKHDIHNIPIYEGDIVKGDMDYGPAGMIESIDAIFFDLGEGSYQFNYFNMGTVEVIGNIYDNSELLREGEYRCMR